MSYAAIARSSIRVPRYFFPLLVLLSFLAATGHRTFALSCGDNVTTDTTLTRDLGPCPGNGLGVDGITAHVTIKLNGHRIIGSGTGNGSGIVLGATGAGVTIQGPGTITRFGSAIAMGGAAVNVIVDHLTFSGNQGGIGMNGSEGPIEIRHNTFIGGQQAQNAINYGDQGGVFIHHNFISKFSGPAIFILGETSSIIEDNVISMNQVGIESGDPGFSGCNEIRRNLITLNSGDGINFGTANSESFEAGLAKTPKCVIEKNTVSFNRGSGIAVTGGDFGVRIKHNSVFLNGGDGIAVFEANPGSIEVVGNTVLGNKPNDLFWDGAGTGACWCNNFFGTSNPAALPACP
jgi:Right handed beta helix region